VITLHSKFVLVYIFWPNFCSDQVTSTRVIKLDRVLGGVLSLRHWNLSISSPSCYRDD